MRLNANRTRRGFTLLEMILALLIGLLLMTAVYSLFDRQFTHSQAGREATQEAQLVRSLFARMSTDIAACLGPYDPKQAPDASAASNTTTNGGSMAQTPTAGVAVPFNVGIQGDANSLTICSTRVPRELIGPDKRRSEVSADVKVSDLRRISYWMTPGQGLAFQEVKRVTGENADAVVDEPDQQIKYVPEVTSITFQFWDGSAWTSSWRSDVPGPDGDLPIGPPAAVEIVIEIAQSSADGETRTRKYRHVVNVPTGNNYSTPQTQ